MTTWYSMLHACGPFYLGRGACLAAISVAGMAIVSPAFAQGQFIPCADLGQPLIRIPELVSNNGKLTGTVVLSDVAQRMALSSPTQNCVPQWVRNFMAVDGVLPGYAGAIPPGFPGYIPATPATQYADPVPGPTLRARLGDLVELTFLNQVDTSHYGDLIDRGDDAGACDESSSGSASATAKGYPQKAADTFPNCFHGSSAGNIHYHGTHTNPNSTGDNVFLVISPSPRSGDSPVVTADGVKKPFDEFFANCEKHLGSNVLSEWPYTWDDLPAEWTKTQQELLKAYDADKPDPQKLWPADAEALEKGLWPQYYIGAYPYCFRIPDFAATTWPPPPSADHAAMHTPYGQPADMEVMGPGAELQMGQSPGTHWYHAHKHGSTTINVLNGMTGAFIIEGRYDDDLNAFYGTPEAPEWTRTQPVLVLNELGVSPPLLGGGNHPLPLSVNGRIQPKLTMRPGEVQMWRIVNTASRSFVNFVGPPAGFSWKQIAQDGIQFSDVNYQANENQSLLMAPGNRVDLLVKAPTTAPATAASVMVQEVLTQVGLTDTTPTPIPLLSIEVSGTPPAAPNQTQFIPKAPVFPAFLADITDKEVQGTKTIVFKTTTFGAPAQHTIDGKQFDDHIGAAVLLNKVEEWKIENKTTVDTNISQGPVDHPFHIHINPFQIVEVFDPNQNVTDPATGQNVTDPATGKPLPLYIFDPDARKSDMQCLLDPRGNPDKWKPCEDSWGTGANLIWWDVFPIPTGVVAKNAAGDQLKDADGNPIIIPGYFKMRSRFVDFPGEFVMHCHILAHEDRGMMTIVAVMSDIPTVRHH